jgi:hypothetical protein
MVYLMKSYYSIYSLVLAEPELPFVVELEYDDDCNSSFVAIVEMAEMVVSIGVGVPVGFVA